MTPENRQDTNQILRPAKIGAVLLAIAVIIGTVINFLPAHRTKVAAETVTATPEATVAATPTPRPTPTPTPTVNSIKLYAYGRELTSDGFTSYVGDKAITLSVVLDPALTHPPVNWSISDSSSASLSVSSDKLSCEFSVLKPSGRNELTISCYGAEAVFPVFLWER